MTHKRFPRAVQVASWLPLQAGRCVPGEGRGVAAGQLPPDGGRRHQARGLRAGATRLSPSRRSTHASTSWRNVSSLVEAATSGRRGRSDPDTDVQFLRDQLDEPYMRRFPRSGMLRRGYDLDDVDESRRPRARPVQRTATTARRPRTRADGRGSFARPGSNPAAVAMPRKPSTRCWIASWRCCSCSAGSRTAPEVVGRRSRTGAEAEMGDYRATYEQSLREPEQFWRAAAARVTWGRQPVAVLDDSRAPFYRWFPDGELNTCDNALDRHVAAGAATASALIYDSPVTGDAADLHLRASCSTTVARFAGALRSLGRREGRPRRHLHADGARGRHRDARLRPARRGALGGVRRLRRGRARRPHRRRAAQGHRVRVLRHRGQPGRRVQAAARRGARARRRTSPARASSCSARRPRRRWSPAATSTGTSVDGRRRARSIRCRSRRPTRSTSSTRRGTTGEAQGRRARQRRPRGRAALVAWRTSTTSAPATSGGRPPTSAGSSATPTSSTRRCSSARRPCSTRASRSARPTRARSGGSSPSTGVRRCSPRRRRSGRSRRRTPRASTSAAYDLSSAAHAVPGRRAARPGHLRLGDRTSSACRWSTTGGRPRRAGRSRRTCAASSRCRSSPARRRCRCPATTCGCSTRRVRGDRPAPRARSASSCRCRPGTLPTLWRDDDRYVASYLSAFAGYYLTGDGGYVDEDGYLFVMGRTDDVINVAGHRLSTGSMEAVLAGAPGRRRVRGDRRADELKGQVPRGLVVLKAGRRHRPRRAARRAGRGGARRDRRGRVVQDGRRRGRRCRRPGRARSCAGRCAASPTASDEPVPSTIEDAGRARRPSRDSPTPRG